MRLDSVDSVRNFSGFGPVYVADRNRVREGLHAHGGFWVTNEVIVAVGSDVSRKRAIKTLRHVKRIVYEIEKGRR